jgi:hypothetical protein
VDPAKALALCHEHATAEAAGEIDRVLATMVPEPLFEFFPIAGSLLGNEQIERFYREHYPRFTERVTGYEMLHEWTNEAGALQEYRVDVDAGVGGKVTYWVMSMMPVDDASGLLTGERVYSDEGFVRDLLGPMYEELQPIETH